MNDRFIKILRSYKPHWQSRTLEKGVTYRVSTLWRGETTADYMISRGAAVEVFDNKNAVSGGPAHRQAPTLETKAILNEEPILKKDSETEPKKRKPKNEVENATLVIKSLAAQLGMD